MIETAQEAGGERSYTVGVYEFSVAGRRFWGQTGNFEEVGDSVSVVYNPANPELNHGIGEPSGFGIRDVKAALAVLFSCYTIRMAIRRIWEMQATLPSGNQTGTRASLLRMKPRELGGAILVALVLYWLAGWIGVVLAAFVIASYFSVPLEQRERDKHKPDSFYDTPYGEG